MLRLFLLVLLLLAVTIVPFLIWGGDLEAALSEKGVAGWMRGFGGWAWAAGIALIASDIALPVPSTAVMAALGIVYGPWIGGAVSAAGSFLAGLLGYEVCRIIGPATAQKLAGAEGFDQAKYLFQQWGGWIVAGSRWLPVLPETISFLAGLTAMPFRRYVTALACGAVPLGFVFATAGHLGSDRPWMMMGICAIAPLVLWMIIRPFLPRSR
ncbi:TVP38/TMEM64 family protein [Falsiphaeobacter marinintestinus]|uniref:TVP38/TMEM64 family protein n=1 Tax=Falsiphaeobacter marinintestinus TaxID=1492905 RepID=UPI0011B38577|nr:VTT domain-containing protein [Phaeobacter marinintestinus]